MNPAERRDAILMQARSGAKLEVEGLARALGASRETIRRDLATLDRDGLLRRVHGGAMAPTEEGPFPDRLRIAVAAKRAIARRFAASLRPGDSLFIDTGSTTFYLAEEIGRLGGLVVITNSADIAETCQKGGNRTILLGGEFRTPGRETLGPLALAQIGQLRAGRAVLTVAGLTARGAYDIDPQEAEIARAMIDRSDEVVILADGSKMGRPGVFELCPMDRIRRIVTDRLPDDIRRAAEHAGTVVDIAD